MSEKKKSVLIIEDDSFIRDILAQKFHRRGWDVRIAGDGESGYKEIQKHPPMVLVLDILLPGMDGHELLERMKGDEKLRDIPVLVLSNYDQKDDIEKSMSLGAVEHLIKSNIILDEAVDKAEEQL